MAAEGVANTSDPTKLDLAGGTMTGPLLLEDGSPAASEEYVAEHGGGGGGGTPSATVVSETAHGQPVSAGAAAEYSRGDHTHGTPAVPTAAQVGADAAGTAAAAVSTHAGATDPHGDRAYALGVVATHVGASDPHGDRAYTDSAIGTHNADTTSVHGIADTGALETTAGATSKANAAQAASIASSAQRASNLSDLASASTARTNLGLGDSATRNVGTAAGTVAAGNDSRLSDARTPTAHASSHQPGGGDAMAVDAAAGVGSLRTLGTGAQQAAAGNHSHGGGSIVGRRAIITTGNATLPNTSSAWAALSGFELAIPAAVGDYVELAVSGMYDPGTNGFVDLAVISGSTLVRYASSGTGTPAIEGDPALYDAPQTYRTSGVHFGLVVASGDLDTGAVRFVVATKSTGSGTLYASSNYPWRWRALNFGQVSFS